MVITLPEIEVSTRTPRKASLQKAARRHQILHLVVEDLGLSRLGLGDQRLVQNIEDILADLLELGLDLLTVVSDGRNMLIGALGLFLLLDGRDDAPRSTSSTNDILVGN